MAAGGENPRGNFTASDRLEFADLGGESLKTRLSDGLALVLHCRHLPILARSAKNPPVTGVEQTLTPFVASPLWSWSIARHERPVNRRFPGRHAFQSFPAV